MSKAQELWDAGHPVKSGQILPAGTEIIFSSHGAGNSVDIYTADVPVKIISEYDASQFRTVEPLPDHNDTGTIRVEVYHDREVLVMLVDTEMESGYDLTETQARNLARKLTEVLDG